MRRVVLCLLSALCLFGYAEDYLAKKAAGKIILDGNLEASEWAGALVFDKFIIHDTDKPGFPAKISMLYDADAIYFGAYCPIPENGGPVLCQKTQHDDNVYRDDCIEVMLDPNKTNDRYFHFLVNAKGVINDIYCDQGGYVSDSKWNSQATAAGTIGDKFWSVEMRIPFSTLDIDPNGNKDWGINLCRDCRKPTQEASIAPHGAFNVAGKFPVLKGIEIDAVKYGWETSPVKVDCRGKKGEYLIDVTAPVSNLSKVQQSVKVDVVLLGEEVLSRSVNKEFAAEESTNVKITDIKLSKAGKYTCVISVLDPVTRKIYKRRTYPINVEFSPLEITLLKPHYRDAIFETQKLKEVVYKLDCKVKTGEITTGIRDLKGNILCKKSVTQSCEVRFPVAPLPYDKMEIFAMASGIEPVVQKLRKLPYKKGEVWMDEQMQWRVDGKRFFFLAEWNDVHTPGVVVSTQQIREPNGKFISFNLMWSSFPGKKACTKDNPTEKELEFYRKVVEKDMEKEGLFAFYLSDEPEISNVSVVGIQKVADFIRDIDPYHPLIISNDTVGGAKDFGKASEINGLHPYPTPAKNKPKSNFGRIVTFMDQTVEFNRNRRHPQTVAYLQQGFNYGDHGATDSRIPSYDEVRSQFLMTLILGGKGIMFYNRTTELYPELFIGMPEVAKEMLALQDVFVEDDVNDASFKVSNPNVRWMMKRHNGEYWLFAVSTTHAKEEATLTFPVFGNRKLNLVREARTVSPVNGVFKDTFDNFEVHIYTTAPAPALEPWQSVAKRIEERNAERRKPGNLVFQNEEEDGIEFEASSNKSTARRADCSLWHVTDGLFIGKNRKNLYSREYWKDATPGVYPDWLALTMPKAHTVSRAVIYPVHGSLKDFEVQAFVDGNWKTVATQKDGSGDKFEYTFPPVVSNRFRLYVTGTHGPDTEVDEIELYEK